MKKHFIVSFVAAFCVLSLSAQNRIVEYYQFMAFLNNAAEPNIPVIEPELAAKRKKIQEQIETLEAALPDKFPVAIRVAWQIPGAAEFESKNGAEAEFLSDGSFRVGGKNPDKDVYTIKFEVAPQRITHVQVEAIPDEKISKGGPGNSESGNFVLSELEMDVLEGRQSNATRNVKFKSAESDYSQDGFPDANAIDGKTDTGWGIGGPGGGPKHRHAIFSLAEPLDLENAANVTIRLVQKFGKQHTLGRFRVSFGQELPDKVITLH